MKLLGELKKPFNIITLILTIASISLSVFFYLNSKKERDLSYQINEPTSVIYDSQNSTSKIKLYERDSVLISNNVYLLTGTFWNSGQLPIYPNDLRRDINLKLGESNRILDYKITKQFDNEVAKFKLKPNQDNSLELKWDYFDPNFGFKFQILYIGDEDPNFIIDGKILDINKINQVKQRPREYFYLSLGIIVSYSILIFILIWRIRKVKNRKGIIDKIYMIMLSLCVIVLFLYMIMTFVIPTKIPF